MFDFIYSENMFILYNFITLYYACFLKFGMEYNSIGFNFNRIDELIINMTILKFKIMLNKYPVINCIWLNPKYGFKLFPIINKI